LILLQALLESSLKLLVGPSRCNVVVDGLSHSLRNRRLVRACDGRRSKLNWPRPSEDAPLIAMVIEGLAARNVSEPDFIRWVQLRTAGRV
jgi:hypothetical protein